MELSLAFGWHLDGPKFPEPSSLGEFVVGPSGLSGQLALRLGLGRPFEEQAVRIAEYVARLGSLESSVQFYSRSFSTDPWGTARALLRLRDELVCAGWVADQFLDFEGRLGTLARLEKLSEHRLTAPSDLCPIMAQTLEQASAPLFKRVRLFEDLGSLPSIWQRIISALAASGSAVENYENTVAATGDLGLIARGLLQHGRTESNSLLCGDGTLTVIESDDEVQAADAVATLLCAIQDGREEMVVIRGNSTSFLDQMLRKMNRPALGSPSRSALRGYAQLLPLALELCWSPRDPARLMELLTLPHGPIPRYAAQCFIYALKTQPGAGGSAWHSAWATALLKKRERLEVADEPLSEQEIEEALIAQRGLWSEWLEQPRVAPSVGMSAAQAIGVCRKVSEHAGKLHARHALEVFGQTALWSQTLACAIETSTLEKMTKAQLDRMLDSVMANGYSADQPEASLWTPVDHPGQIYAQAGTTLWWGFVNNGQEQRFQPWTAKELALLTAEGVQLERPVASIAREAASWRKPILNSRRLILVKPRTVAGRPVAAHPLFHEFAQWLETAPPVVRSTISRQAHEIYRNASLEFCGERLVRQDLPKKELPQARALWTVAPGLVAARNESPSSLEMLFGCPFAWLLQYVLRLRSGSLLSMALNDQICGNLAHAVFAEIFGDESVWMRTDLANVAETRFDDLCEKIALPLLLPGKSLERARLRKTVAESVVHLASMIKEAGFVRAKTEVEQECTIQGVTLTGRADMILSKEDLDAILDLKVAAGSSFRRRELLQGRAIQLACYASINGALSGRPTIGGYYMLGQKQLLASASEPFPPHTLVPGPTLAETFAKIICDYRQHLEHLQGGSVFATGVNGGDGETIAACEVAGTALALEPPCRNCRFDKLCGRRGFAK